MRKIIYIILLFGFWSCEERIDWDIQPDPINTIVVDAIITNEAKLQEVRLSKHFADQNGDEIPVSGAIVKISIDAVTIDLVESIDDPGMYRTTNNVAATINKTYSLHVQYAAKEYFAETYMIPVIPSYPLLIVPVENSPGMREILWTAPQYNPDDLAMYQVDIDWSHLVDTSIKDTLTRARLFRYTLNTVDVNNIIFPQEKEVVYFPKGSILTAQKFSVNDEYGNYLRALLSETEWQGSLFEEIRGNLPTNISNGGLGYFSVCSVVKHTQVVP